jgi:hypothetical protein
MSCCLRSLGLRVPACPSRRRILASRAAARSVVDDEASQAIRTLAPAAPRTTSVALVTGRRPPRCERPDEGSFVAAPVGVPIVTVGAGGAGATRRGTPTRPACAGPSGLDAVAAAIAWAGYVVLTQRVGDEVAGLQGLAISMPVAGLVATVVAGPSLVGDLTLQVLLAGLGLAILLVIPFALEMLALRRLTATAFGTLRVLSRRSRC